MKSNVFFQRLVTSALLALGGLSAMAQAPGQVLVGATHFEMKSIYAGSTYVGFDEEVVQTGLTKIKFETPILRIDKDPNANGVAWDYETGASDFHDTPHWAVTDNPIKLDSALYVDEKNSHYMVFSTPTGYGQNKPMCTFKVAGCKPGASLTIKLGIRSGMDASHATNSCGAASQMQFKMRMNENGGKVGNAEVKAEGDYSVLMVGDTKEILFTKGLVSSDGEIVITIEPQLNNMQCAPLTAYLFDYLEIWTEIDPKIEASTDKVCAGGETVVLSLDRVYNDVEYQWYKGNSKIPGATESSYSHESGDVKDVETTYYCEIIPKNGGSSVKTKEGYTVKDIECCIVDNKPQSRKLIWKDDFGTATSATDYWTWDYGDIRNPKKVTHTDGKLWQHKASVDPEDAEYHYVTGSEAKCEDNKIFGEGRYTVAGNVTAYDGTTTGIDMGWAGRLGNGLNPSANGWKFTPDHTYGTDNSQGYGCMMFLNIGSSENAVIYKREITGLCERKMTVQCSINNFSSDDNPVEIYIRLTDLNDRNNVVESDVVKRSVTEGKLAWRDVEANITLTGSDMLFEIISLRGNPPGFTNDMQTSPNRSGNDLILDDILVYACASPGVSLYFDIPTHLEEIESCDGTDNDGNDIKLYVEKTKMITTNLGEDVRLLFQYCIEDPEDLSAWVTLGGITKDFEWDDITEAIEAANFPVKDKVYFRAVLGSEFALTTTTEFNPNEPCGSYSVSNVIELDIKCPECTKPKDDIKIKSSKTPGLTQYKGKNVVELCYGESVTLSQSESILPDESEWASPEFGENGYSIKWEVDGVTSVTEKVLNGTISSLPISYDDDALEGNLVPVVLYAVDAYKPEGTCKTGDTIYIKFNPKPDAEYRAIEPFCEGKGDDVSLDLVGGTESDYLVKWWSGADSTGTPIGEDIKADFFQGLTSDKSGTFSYVLFDKKTKCQSELKQLEITVNPVPDAPKDEELEYTINGQANSAIGTEKFKKNNLDGTYDLLWFKNATDPDSKGSTDGVSIDRSQPTKESPYTFYIAFKDPTGGCVSERAKVIVNVLEAPAPETTVIEICKDGTFDIMDGVQDPDTDYELIWFEDDPAVVDTTGKALTSPSLSHVDVTKPGEYEVYVAQRGTKAPFAQSSVSTIVIKVYGVDKPVDKSKHEYCANTDAEPLKADLVKDESKYMYADAIWFKIGETTPSKTLTPITTTNQTTKNTYTAYQSYTIESTGEQCEGEEISIDVDVIAVEAPKVNISPVSYVKSEGEGPNGFDHILDKYPSAIDQTPFPNVQTQKLKWSRNENGPFIEGNTLNSKPVYDASVAPGTVESQERWMLWDVTTASGLECSSDPKKIEITISSTPAPIVNPIAICQEVFKNGPIDPSLELSANAEVNDNGGTLPNSSAYQLYWFTNKADADAAMSDNSKLSLGTTTAPLLQSVAVDTTTNPNEPEWIGEIYVVQSDGTTTSPSSTVKVTVNATPKLAPKAYDPVCGDDEVVDLTNGKYWNVSNGVRVDPTYKFNGTVVTSSANNLTEAGEYEITATSLSGCKSETLKLQLDIRKLSIKVEDLPTCPDGDVDENVEIKFTYNKNAAGANNVQLSVSSNEPTSSKNSQNFVITNPAGGYSDDFTYTYTTGTFSDNVKTHTVTVVVTDGVCMATKDFKVKIGDGPAGGYYLWNEVGNESPVAGNQIELRESEKNKIMINACGDDVTVDFSGVDKTSNTFEWYTSPDYSAASKVKNSDAKQVFSPSEYKTYYLRYENTCYAYATVTIKDASVKILTLEQPDVNECENTPYSLPISIQCPNPDMLAHQWYKDGQKYSSGDELSFKPLLKKDEGTYSVEYTNYGCVAKLDPVVKIKVREYVKFEIDDNTVEPYEGKPTQIVTAGENAKVGFVFTTPSDPSALLSNVTEDPNRNSNNGTISSDNLSYVITKVDEDHRNIVVSFKNDDYCERSKEFQVLRDAKLILNAHVDTAMCLRDNKKFTIDTIGTGAFRRQGMSLTITAEPEGGSAKAEKGFVKDSKDTLWKNISPSVTTTYKINFDYNGQHRDTSIKVTVYNFRVELANDTVCAGEPVELKCKVYPDGSMVEWFDEDGNSLGSNPGTVVPEFKGAANAPRYSYKYKAVPYSDLVTCSGANAGKFLVVDVYRPLEGEMKDTTICEGQPVRVDASSYGASSWTWTVNGDEIKGGRVYPDTPSETTTYYVHMTRGNVCEKDAQATVTVKKNPVIESIDSLDYRVVDVVMAPDFGTAPYRFKIDEGDWTEDSRLTGLAYTVHTIFVEDAQGCTLLDTFVVNSPAINIPYWFSPNKDGEYDNWTVPGIQDTYPEAEFTIFDRWGKKLAEFKGEDAGWDGTYNGVDMPSTDYWYELIVREIDKIYTGHFTLIRR